MRRIGIAAALLLACTAPARAAVEEYLGKTVASVRLDVEGRELTEQAVVDVVETRIGRPLSMAEARQSITHLFSLGRFEDVQLHAEATPRGVALRYELVPIHHVAKLAFRERAGRGDVDEGQLRRAVVDRYGVSPAVGRAEEIARLVADTLRQRGYLHAAVAPKVEIEHRPERATLAFEIEPGPRTRIGTVDVVGTPSVPIAELLRRLKLTRGNPYERERLDERIERYVESRRAHGFYESRIIAAVQLDDNDRIANITLNAMPGPRVRVVFTGDPLPPDRRDDLVPVQREGSVDEDLLEDSSHRIEELLRAQGYRDARAAYSRQQQDGDLVITFDVHRGPQYRVERVQVSGNASIAAAAIAPLLHAREHQPFAAANVDADVAAIENLYHREGFTTARAQVAVAPEQVVPNAAIVPVDVNVAITEGVRTVVRSVRIDGNSSVPGDTLRAGLGLQPGRPFFAPQAAADRDAVQAHYGDLGYQAATVDVNPGLSPDGSQADVVFTVREGARIIVDHILIVGNVRTGTSTIQRELQIKPGDPMGISAVNDSQRRLTALGLFRSVRISELRHGEENRRDLLVTVEEAPATTISWGGGFEVKSLIGSTSDTGVASQQLDFAPRASFTAGRRNLFGKNRSIDLFTSVAVHRNDTVASAASSEGRLAEYRVVGTFREPRVFGSGEDAFVTGTLEHQIRSSFTFRRRSATADAGRKLTRDVSVTGSYQIQSINVSFNPNVTLLDRNLIDRFFPQVLLSMFSTSVIRDTRDDAIDPSGGTYSSANGQIAGRAIGSEVGFGKTFATTQIFKRLPGSRRIIFAGDARLGLATGFPRTVVVADNQGQTTVQTVTDVPASERFFAGGDTTVRGFALDELGTPDTLKNGFPIGGNALVILNAELRATVHGGFGVVGFFDTGNVFVRAVDLNLGDLRSAVGFGIRYKSPIGPLRVDLGFKVHRLPGESLTALHISLGQAF